MLKRLIFLIAFLVPSLCYGAISVSTIWEFNASSTANMLNAGGFNTANANFLTNGSWTSANTNAPVLTSASYSFVAGDVANWVYSKTTTNSGFFKILSVNAGAATVDGTIGNAIVLNTTTNRYGPSTIVGVDSSASPSSKTFGVDYSQSTTAVINGVTDFASVGGTSTLTSATAGFTAAMPGNHFHQITTGTGADGTVGWYEVVSVTNSTTVTLDRSPNVGVTSALCTGYVGGSLDLAGALQTSFFSQLQASNFVFIKKGAYTLGATLTASAAGATTTSPTYIIGYNALRGDTPLIGSGNQPVITNGALILTLTTAQQIANITGTGTGTTVINTGTAGSIVNCKVTNTSTSANRTALSGGTGITIDNSEFVSQNGIALALNANSSASGIYTHDSTTCVNVGATGGESLANSIIASCTTTAVNGSNAASNLSAINNTIYGSAAQAGNGFLILNADIRWWLRNNLIVGTALAVSQATAQVGSNIDYYTNFWNNTTDTTLFTKDITDVAVNPSFNNMSEVTGTVGKAQTASKFQDSTKNFTSLGVVANQDYLRYISGTGTAGIYLITAISTTTNPNDTLTLNNSAGTGNVGDGVYSIPIGHDFTVTNASAKGTGFPGTFAGGLSVGHMTIGAMQPNPTSGGSSGGSYAYVQ